MHSSWTWLFLSSLSLGCSGGGSGAVEGELGGDCYGNGTCDDGLECVADVCLDTTGDAGPIDANSSDALVVTSCGGVVPNVDGEFLLAMSLELAPGALIRFAATTTTDSTVSPATIALTLQPICAQEAQCVLGEYVGSPIVLAAAALDVGCEFTAALNTGIIPGGANAISGSDIAPDMLLPGSLEDTSFYCGTTSGTIAVGGATVPVTGTFGARSMPTGTTGSALPVARPSCANL